MFERLLVLAILNDEKIELHIPTIITRPEIKIIFSIMDICSLTQSGIHGPSDMVRDFVNIVGAGHGRSEISKIILVLVMSGSSFSKFCWSRTVWS